MALAVVDVGRRRTPQGVVQIRAQIEDLLVREPDALHDPDDIVGAQRSRHLPVAPGHDLQLLPCPAGTGCSAASAGFRSGMPSANRRDWSPSPVRTIRPVAAHHRPSQGNQDQSTRRPSFSRWIHAYTARFSALLTVRSTIDSLRIEFSSCRRKSSDDDFRRSPPRAAARPVGWSVASLPPPGGPSQRPPPRGWTCRCSGS